MNKTKKSFLMSVLSLLLCFSMFVGSTFAWFTDEVTSAGNKIQSGTLKVDLELLDKETGNWNSLKETQAPIFDYDKWEPGYIDTKILKVENEGSLALKWVAKFYSEKQLSILADVIDVYVCPSESELAYPDSRELEGYECVGNLNTFINSIEETTYGALEAGETAYLGIALKMREEAGNEYQGLSLGGAFDIRLYATQYTSESDSFDNQYDKNATFEDLANTSIRATETKTLAAGADSVEFNLSSNGLTIAKVIVPANAIADTTKPVTVTFDGITPSEEAIIDDNTQAYAYDIDVTNLKDNLEGDQLVTVVVTAPNALAAMKAYHNGTLIEDAVYDEVEGTITFKTASFSPYDFTSQVKKVSTLQQLRVALQNEGTTAQLEADLLIDLKAGSADRSEDHKALSTDGKSIWYNGVNIKGKNVGLDLNGHKITVKCYDADNYNGYSNQDVGALFFVDKEGSLNITDRVGGGFIKMASSIYAVWAPYDETSYMDIYSGVFIADSYAGDPIGTPPEADDNPMDDKMKYENSNRALIYAGTGGNMNIYGGYYLYNNTPNDFLNRNNGAFNCTNWYEGPNPFITIHDGVMLIDKGYRQDPTYTSTPNGSFDDYSIKLAKDCEIAEVQQSVTIDGQTYSTWYKVKSLIKLTGITVAANKNAYDVAKNETFSSEDITVTATYSDGTTKQVTDFTVTFDNSDFTSIGAHNGTVSYTYDDLTVTGSFVVYCVKTNEISHSNYTDGGHGLHFDWFSVNNEQILFPESGSGTKAYDNGLEATYTYASDLVVNNSNAGRVTVNQAQLAPNFSLSGWVGYDKNFEQFGIYVDDVSNLIVYEKFMDAEEAVQNLAGPYAKRFFFNGVDISGMNLSSGKHTMTFVAIHSDGIQELTTWTLYVNSTEDSDISGKTANVIILAGQSNAYGVSPMTDAIKEKVADTNFSNIRIRYTNLGNASTDIAVGQWQTVSQSNSTGFEHFTPGVGGPNVMYFGPELAIAQYLATNNSDEVWYIIKYAAAGSLLNGDWYDGTVNRTVTLNGQATFLATEMLDYVQESLTEIEAVHGDNINIQSFMWMQGESEAGDMSGSWAANYDGLEQQLVNDIRTKFATYTANNNGADIKFVDAEVAAYKEGTNTWFYSDNGTYSYQGNSFSVTDGVNDQKEANSAARWDPNTGIIVVNTNPGISNSILFATNTLVTKLEANNENNENDGAHYSSDSMWSLGTWFAEAMFKEAYTVTYDVNGGTLSGDTSVTVNAGESVILPTPTKSGYLQTKFQGWSDGTNTYVAGASYVVTGNVTLTAQWGW